MADQLTTTQPVTSDPTRRPSRLAAMIIFALGLLMCLFGLWMIGGWIMFPFAWKQFEAIVHDREFPEFPTPSKLSAINPFPPLFLGLFLFLVVGGAGLLVLGTRELRRQKALRGS